MLQDVAGRGIGSKTDMLQDVSGRGTWSKKCFKVSLPQALGLWQSHLEQEMLQDVSGRGTWSKTCFKMSLVAALGARHASGCLW